MGTGASANARTIPWRNVLFATDFSEASEAARHWALAMARWYGAALTVVHVTTARESSMPPVPAALEARALRRRAERCMKEFEARHLRDLPHKAVVEEGSVEEAIRRVVEREGTDLVVVGTHGHAGLKHLLLGSVAEAIVRSAPCPVLTVCSRAVLRIGPDECLSNILFPTDFSSASVAALEKALALAACGARLTLLHVIDPRMSDAPDERRAARQEAERRLAGLLPPGVKLAHEPACVAAFGRTVETILETAASTRADLIVLGGVGAARDWTRALASATAYRVSAQARCPVLSMHR